MGEHSFSHIPVLLEETAASLQIRPDGFYIDATAGGGGHSSRILEELNEQGTLLCLDQDPDAIAVLTERFRGDARVTVVHDNFKNIKSRLAELNLGRPDGILADLGVSSHQLDTAERGFSFHADAPLDMRMSQEGPTAADLCNSATEQELKQILYTYGEESYAPLIAKAIVKQREEAPLRTTGELDALIHNAVPAKYKRNKHPSRKTFQALRIAVNGEMDVLDIALNDMFDVLLPGGVLSIITFHSLEDRMVKQRFQSFCQGCTCPPEFPVCVCGKTPDGKLSFKFKTASEEELGVNLRSRSAKLRSVVKLKDRTETD